MRAAEIESFTNAPALPVKRKPSSKIRPTVAVITVETTEGRIVFGKINEAVGDKTHTIEIYRRRESEGYTYDAFFMLLTSAEVAKFRAALSELG